MRANRLPAVFAVVLLLPPAAHSQALPVLRGQLGAGHVSFPQTLTDRRVLLGWGMVYTQYGSEDPRGEMGEYGLSVTFGISQRLDLALSISYSAVNTGEEDFNRAGISLKYLAVSGGGPFTVAVGATVLPTLRTADRLVASSGLNYLGQIIAGWQSGSQQVAVEVAFGRVDFLPQRSEVLGAELAVRGGACYLRRFSGGFRGYVELVGASVPAYQDEDLFVQIGAILQIGRLLDVTVGAGVGLPNAVVANTDKRAVLRLRHVFFRD